MDKKIGKEIREIIEQDISVDFDYTTKEQYEIGIAKILKLIERNFVDKKDIGQMKQIIEKHEENFRWGSRAHNYIINCDFFNWDGSHGKCSKKWCLISFCEKGCPSFQNTGKKVGYPPPK